MDCQFNQIILGIKLVLNNFEKKNYEFIVESSIKQIENLILE